MKKIFISHAANEKGLATALRRTIAAAVGVQPGEIFYSSGAGTGIPAGMNFVSYIKEEMQDSTYVIALIGPNYLASEFCLAELGAVWYADTKEFHPLCTPSVDRRELKASLTGIQVDEINDPVALQDLLQRVAAHFGRDHNAAACTGETNVFLKELPAILESLPEVSTVPRETLAQSEAVNEALAKELSEERLRYGALTERFANLQAAKTAPEAEAIGLPATVEQQIDEALVAARDAVRQVANVVRRSVAYRLRSEGMPWPDQMTYEFEDAQKAIDAGFLIDSEDGTLHPNLEWPAIELAAERTGELQEILSNLDRDQTAWFKDHYGVPPDLSQIAAFDELL